MTGFSSTTLPFQDETGHTAPHAASAASTRAERAGVQQSHAWYAKRDVSVAYARHPRRPGAEPATTRQRINELETALRHKDLKLQAALSENQAMRQNLHKLMNDLEVMEKIVATLGHRRRA